MKDFNIALYSMLALLMISNVFSPVSAVTPVKVNLHEAATLPCNRMCSGLVTWTVFHKAGDILAQCNQTSCQSKEGFHMSHDQYLKGDLSLTINDVDYTKRAWYTCECEAVDICDLSIQIESVNVHKHFHPGESLSMDVNVSEPVEVILNRTGDTKPNTVKLCEIRGREIQCVPEYEKRVSFSFSLQLKDLEESDCGVYNIRDTRNDEVIAAYSVIAGGSLSSHPCPSSPWNGLDSTKEPDDSRCRSHLKTVLRQEPQNPVIRVKLNENPTLPCSQTCSSLVTWTVYHKPDDILAQCNQTSCQSKEGFHMSHDQYLKGDFSLTITDVEFNKSAWYTCSCSGKTLCDWNLQVHAFSFKVHVHRGESLSMNVPISVPVEVILNRTGDTKPTTVRLCEITGREVQCVSEYGKRVSFSSSLQLKGLKESDSGVYTIQDTSNEEVIATYTVTTATFGGMKEEPDTHTVLAVVLPLVILILLVSAVVLFRNRLQNCWSCKNVQPNELVQQEMNEEDDQSECSREGTRHSGTILES